jgi:hypothetical protein
LPQFFLTVFLLTAFSLAGQEKIPLLISEHHADHMEFFLRYGGYSSAAMIVLDAHADTVKNEQSETIRGLSAVGNFSSAGELAGNNNWIHPLASTLVKTLVWISTIQNFPNIDTLYGFFYTVSTWNEEINTYFLSIEELYSLEISGETLFISVDLDFFYSEDHVLDDVFSVFNSLFEFSSCWQGPVVWAICLSRPWLPDDLYAWNLLGQSLQWLSSRPEFDAVEITLFNSQRIDTSRTAQIFSAEGRKMPMLREEDAPEQIKIILWELQQRE